MEPPTAGSAVALTGRALIRRLLQLAWRYRAGCLKVLALQFVLLLMGVSGLGAAGLGIDYIRFRVMAGAPPPRWPFGLAPPTAWPPLLTLAAIGGFVLGVALLRALLNYGYTVQAARLLQQQIVVQLRAEVYGKLQRLSFRFFDENASGSIINRVTRDVQHTRMFVDGVVLQGIIILLTLGVYLGYMLHLSSRLTLACLAPMPLLALLSAAFTRHVRPAYRHSRELFDRLVLTLAESVQGIPVVKGFAREPEFLARFRAANRRVRDQNHWIFAQVSRFVPTTGFLTQFSLVILLGYGGSLVIRGELALGAGLVVFAGLLQQFSSQVAGLANLANSIQESLVAARRVFEVLDAPIEIRSPPKAVRLPAPRGAVAFEGVWFAYHPEQFVLRDIALQVAPGECVAIVGPTGAGKSTLLSLIPRFYDPCRGRVLFDGHDVRTLDLDDLRRSIGIVFQENFLFSQTVAANIAFGAPDASRERIERAARAAAAHDFIMALPRGYDTVLGEGGGDLSGGQRQRLAIARALLLEPAVLLLDDPTAAVDADTEHEILTAMDNAMRGRTTFVIAHRLSTLRRADRIIVLEHGRIVQSGTHEELIRRRGPYQRLAALQMADEESLRLLSQPPGAGVGEQVPASAPGPGDPDHIPGPVPAWSLTR